MSTTSIPLSSGSLRIRRAIILTYMLFGALLNSVGAVNLLVVQTLGVPRAEAALLDAWKDLPIALTSFLVASLLPRLGLKRSMLLAVAAVGAACLAMPVLSAFWAIKLLFCTLSTPCCARTVSVSTSNAYASTSATLSPARCTAPSSSTITGPAGCRTAGGSFCGQT